MFTRLFALSTLVLFVAASPVVTRDNLFRLPTTRHLVFKSGGSTLLEVDQARARGLKSRKSSTQPNAAAPTSSIGVTNVATVYTAEVLVGTPGKAFTLLVDTGSSNTWVGANTSNRFVPSSSTEETLSPVEVTYGSGEFAGVEVIDTVKLGDMTITKQSLGSADFAEGFDGFDGILGIGPTDLTEDTVLFESSVPTVTDNAFSQGLIPNKQVGVSFEPTTSLSDANGELTFGGADPTKFTGDLHTVPITSTSPASEFFGIDQTVSYGAAPILNLTSGIVDTGTTLTLLATDALDAYTAATGAVMDPTTGLLTITPAQFANLQSLVFNIGGENFELTPNAQLWPRALNTAIGGEADAIYLIVGDLGTLSGEGLDFINGFTFLERFYTVFDSGASTVSFATTPFTTATTN